ncbi:hypothetical protein ASE04_25590 [Rhizobium sp. Root708]|nr:hypothetical protein ASE04_25590 [Rhizobium sp. Root708]
MLIGIDVGTTAVKAARFDMRGNVERSYARHYPTRRQAPHAVEQDPDDWMVHVQAALQELSDGLAPGQLQAIGLCSHVNSHVFVAADGEVLMPAIIWQDGRCAEVAAELDAQVTEQDKIKWWGAPLPVDASHVLSRMEWVKRYRPDVWQKTRWVMSPKDYCILQLTGKAVADPMTSFGVVDRDLRYIDSLIGLVDGAAERLAPISAFTSIAGRIKPGMPASGTPMAVATMDAWSGLFGCGAIREGDGFYLSGTSEVLGIISGERNPEPGVIAFPRCEAITLHAAPTQAGGASMAWLSTLLGRSPTELSALAAQVDRHQMMPVFLPHLQGERAPVWNIHARASFSGIDSAMGPAEFTVSMMEGVAFSVRMALDSLQRSAGVVPQILSSAGGGMGSDVWCQIRADVLGKPLHRRKNLDAGVLGAAVLAGAAASVFPSLADAAAQLVVTERTFEPNPSLAERYAYGYEKYRELYRQLEAFNRDLVLRSQ